MLKNFGYDGVYRNQNLSVSVLLENPLDYNLEIAKLIFSVTIRDKKKGVVPHLEDFTFYLMDEKNHIYNMQKEAGLQVNIKTTAEDNESVRKPDTLISTDFNPKFLFENLRIVFYYEPDQKFYIMELTH